jgi:hypothetical protein
MLNGVIKSNWTSERHNAASLSSHDDEGRGRMRNALPRMLIVVLLAFAEIVKSNMIEKSPFPSIAERKVSRSEADDGRKFGSSSASTPSRC